MAATGGVLESTLPQLTGGGDGTTKDETNEEYASAYGAVAGSTGSWPRPQPTAFQCRFHHPFEHRVSALRWRRFGSGVPLSSATDAPDGLLSHAGAGRNDAGEASDVQALQEGKP